MRNGNMGILEALQKRVKAFNDGLTGGQFISEIIRNHDWEIVEMNTQEQLFEQGITATGISIMDYMPYAPMTVDIKKIKGQPYDRVTLRDEGDFQNSFEVETDHEKMTIVATDRKTDELLYKYGDEIMGLTDKNVERLEREILLPDLMKQAQQTLFTK